MLTEAHRAALQIELDEALRERERLDNVIAYLAERLGADPNEVRKHISASDSGTGTETQKIELKGDVVAQVNPGQFYGFAAGKAAVQVLEMAGEGHPLRASEIYRAVKKGGVTIKDGEMLGRAMRRHKDILRVGRGLWGLRKWYPANAKEWTPDTDLESDDEENNGVWEDEPEVG
jgi:hypothetical protein